MKRLWRRFKRQCGNVALTDARWTLHPLYGLDPDNLVTCRVETVDPIKCSVKRFMSDGTFKIESSEERVFMTITVAVRHRGGFIPEQNMDSVEIFAVDVLLRLIPVPVSAFPDKELCNTYRFGHDFAWWDVEIGVVRASR